MLIWAVLHLYTVNMFIEMYIYEWMCMNESTIAHSEVCMLVLRRLPLNLLTYSSFCYTLPISASGVGRSRLLVAAVSQPRDEDGNRYRKLRYW